VRKLNLSPRQFSLISWGVTALVVFSLLGFTMWRISPASAGPAVEPEPVSVVSQPANLPAVTALNQSEAIVRSVALVTASEKTARYKVQTYTVERGDTASSIARDFGLEASSLLWSNEDLMRDGPNSLKVGQELQIPPVDGVLHKWQPEDTFESVADQFGVTADDIILWPGNSIELSDPKVEPGTYVMVPGGKSDAINWVSVSFASGASGTSSAYTAICPGGGPIGGGGTLLWPTPYHYINGGNNFSASHLAVDLWAPEGTLISAADNGVVVWASYGAWNGGYGNVIMVDHGNGFKTLYGHLSQVNVQMCQPVYAGETIGLSGDTGNSFGAHLHFEVRLGGGFMNPFDYLPPP
jgi:murein DD-endopeptidase MepM/ murein hydrolase activator NlpD